MSSQTKLRLGTRSSLLAVAQSNLIRTELEAVHPGVQVELVHTDTRGDVDLQTPLTQVKDPDFFSAELDQALLDGEVDFCVHSFKDLARTRPPGITTAAIPAREQPHDVILFRADILEYLQHSRTLRVGTCSLRREINVSDFLRATLPVSSQPVIETLPLRGPVDERVLRILPDTDSYTNLEHEQLDAVVLALAGLNRLAGDPRGQRAIAHALDQARLMVMPLSACPAAPGQGALAVECRNDDADTKAILAALHSPQTAELIKLEQNLLDELAASDHSGVGATVIPNAELNYVARVRGHVERNSEQLLEYTRSGQQYAAPAESKPWDDSAWRVTPNTEWLPVELPVEGAAFAAHWRALDGHTVSPRLRCWTSGMGSWKKLAKQGVWVEGCADDLGFMAIAELLNSAALQLPPLANWTALPHEDAVDSWSGSGIVHVMATYRSHQCDQRPPTSLADCTHFYWSSARQFELLRADLPAEAVHACGAGKTLQQLRAAGLTDVHAFTSRQEWLQWLS